ncbi:MAG: GHKL domain-containing protein [Ruminococcaceae bacterium]|nr:GHKL domain-containing protein [Oscillospiraceae bacterium]
MAITLFRLLNYGLVMIYGTMLTVGFAGGCHNKRQKITVLIVIVSLLLLQAGFFALFGIEVTEQLYPLIAHLPLILVLALGFKRSWGISLTSMLTAYFCCQLPLWVGTFAMACFRSELAYEISYFIAIFPIFFLLRKYFTNAVQATLAYSRQSLFLFCSLPLIYYLFDYATAVYSDVLYTEVKVAVEFLPAIMAVFYVLFVSAYHYELQKRNRIELQSALLSMQLSQAETEMDALQQMQIQTVAYRHDMRHHLSMLDALLKNDDVSGALKYIESAENDISRFTPVKYCENAGINLIVSAFAKKAEDAEVSFTAEVDIPAQIPLSETELCALLSNALENAVTVASQQPSGEPRRVLLKSTIRKGNLLLYVENGFKGEVSIKDGLPSSEQEGHGFGVKSMHMIAEKHGGYCAFSAEHGVFTVKIVLPLK